MIYKINADFYKITADYRPQNPNKPTYYVMAHSKKSAKETFSEIISWLKIYSCEECDEEEKNRILSDPCRYFIFTERDYNGEEYD